MLYSTSIVVVSCLQFNLHFPFIVLILRLFFLALGLNYPDPEEPFTTLLPSMRTTTYTLSTQLMTTKMQTQPTSLAPEPERPVAAAKFATSNSHQLKAIISPMPQQFLISLKSADSNNQSITPNESNLIVFYIAIVLSILCYIIVADLVIFYYRLF